MKPVLEGAIYWYADETTLHLGECQPYTHRCPNGCPPAPGPDYPNDLCSKCLDEIWEDWGKEVVEDEQF